MAERKTYTITAFNHRIQMIAVVNYYPFTSKRQALDVAKRMVDTGAKDVTLSCDQTEEIIFKSVEQKQS